MFGKFLHSIYLMFFYLSFFYISLEIIQGPGGMNSMNPRLNHPRGQPMGPMAPGGYGGMRPPPSSMGPGPGPGGPMPPGMGMPPGGGRPWQQPNTSNMNYSSASPSNHYAVCF